METWRSRSYSWVGLLVTAMMYPGSMSDSVRSHTPRTFFSVTNRGVKHSLSRSSPTTRRMLWHKASSLPAVTWITYHPPFCRSPILSVLTIECVGIVSGDVRTSACFASFALRAPIGPHLSQGCFAWVGSSPPCDKKPMATPYRCRQDYWHIELLRHQRPTPGTASSAQDMCCRAR